MFMKTGKVSRRVVRHSDIVNLASFFEYLSKKEFGSCTFSVSFRDHSFASVDSAEYFQKPYFKYKDVSQIRFEYISYNYKNKVILYLEESAFFFTDTSRFEVINENEDWLNAAFVKMNDLIAGLPKHSILRTAFSFPWILFSYIFFQILCSFVMRLIGFTKGNKPVLSAGQPNAEVFFLPMSLYFLLVVIVFALISAIICMLYPVQEFAFGNSRHPMRVKIRKTFGWILATIIIPIILSILF